MAYRTADEIKAAVGGGVDVGVRAAIDQLAEKTESGGVYTDPQKWGSFWLWIDATGDLRVHNAKPTADNNGTVVGTQT